jgi:outer membrane protein TolC
MPLYDRGKSIDIELKKIALMKSKMKLEKTKQELEAQIKSLKDGIVLLKKSKKLNDENIQNQKNLLKYAKMSFDEGRMTQEDYLRYEDALLNAKSAYFEVVSQIWQNIGKLAVIYGVDLKEIVR